MSAWLDGLIDVVVTGWSGKGRRTNRLAFVVVVLIIILGILFAVQGGAKP